VTPADQGGEPLRPTVAAFDFDGTLTNAGSILPFLVRLRGWPTVAGALWRTALPLLRGAVFGGEATDRAKETLFGHLLAGQNSIEVDKVSIEFAEDHLRRHLRPEVNARLVWHLDQGHRVVVISASPECYVRPAAELLGADGVLATRLAVGGGGLLTGRYEGKNCRGPEKYARLVGWLRAEGLAGAGLPQPVLWAYGNSRGDLRLLEAVDHGVDCGRLGRFGRLRRFPSLASRRPPR
jgi:phosphatidylglycerophosphatase C